MPRIPTSSRAEPPININVSFMAAYSFFPATPDADQQVHGDEGHLVKHEHGEEVHGDKEPEYPDGQQVKPQEILFLQEVHFP